MEDDSVFFDVLSKKIDAKVSIETNNGCKLWRTESDYPKMRVKFPGKGEKTYYVHRLVVMISLKVKILPDDFEVSHLCHNKSCCNLEHLSLEPHYVNGKRMQCKTQSKCQGHDEYPNCLL